MVRLDYWKLGRMDFIGWMDGWMDGCNKVPGITSRLVLPTNVRGLKTTLDFWYRLALLLAPTWLTSSTKTSWVVVNRVVDVRILANEFHTVYSIIIDLRIHPTSTLATSSSSSSSSYGQTERLF